jgi:hypothetical protein
VRSPIARYEHLWREQNRVVGRPAYVPLSEVGPTVEVMDSRTAHSTSTGDSVAARESKLAADRDRWRREAQALESDWPEEWVIVTTFRQTGDKAYWSDRGRSPYPGNARRYASEEVAQDAADALVARAVLDEYSLERRQRPRGGLRGRGEQ